MSRRLIFGNDNQDNILLEIIEKEINKITNKKLSVYYIRYSDIKESFEKIINTENLLVINPIVVYPKNCYNDNLYLYTNDLLILNKYRFFQIESLLYLSKKFIITKTLDIYLIGISENELNKIIMNIML